MSAIVGIYYFDGRTVNPTILERMLETNVIVKHGNDAKGSWINGSVGLAQRAFWTTHEQEFERQPTVEKDSDLTLVLDGRIDNRSELIHQLKVSGIKTSLVTDADIVLNAYKIWGKECPAKIIGDFAFVIWDSKQHELFCVRDPLGVRPFYYFEDNSLFAFATDPEALFTLPEVSREPNLSVLTDNLLNNYSDSKQTEFKQIYRLRPAHFLKITEHSIQTYQYWDIDPDKHLKLSGLDEYKEAFLSIFTTAITDRLRTSREIGVVFSGGLDSSSILCQIEDLKTHDKNSKKICAYSILFNEGDSYDERHYMQSVQDKWGTKIHWLQPEPPIPIWNQTEILRGTAQSMSNPMGYTMEAVFERAVSHRTGVLLTGHGGDDFMDSVITIANKMLAKGKILSVLHFISAFKKFQEVPLSYIFNSLVYGPLVSILPYWLKKFYRSLKPKRTYPWICNPFAEEALGRLSNKPWYSYERPATTTIHKPGYNIIHDGHRIGVFERWDRLTSAAGEVELRHPFCDRRLVELALSIPDEVMIHEGEPKGLLRQAMEPKLPKLIRNRKNKADYGDLLKKQIFIDGTPFAEKLLNSPYLEEIGLIDGKIAKTIYNDCCSKGITRLSWDISEGFIQLLFLEAWARKAFNNEETFVESGLAKENSRPLV